MGIEHRSFRALEERHIFQMRLHLVVSQHVIELSNRRDVDDIDNQNSAVSRFKGVAKQWKGSGNWDWTNIEVDGRRTEEGNILKLFR